MSEVPLEWHLLVGGGGRGALLFHGIHCLLHHRRLLSGSRFGFRVSSCGFRFFGFRFSGFKFRVSGSGFGFRISGSRFRNRTDLSSQGSWPSARFRVSDFELRIQESNTNTHTQGAGRTSSRKTDIINHAQHSGLWFRFSGLELREVTFQPKKRNPKPEKYNHKLGMISLLRLLWYDFSSLVTWRRRSSAARLAESSVCASSAAASCLRARI